ncbi:unnamed protein product [Caenorhabditis bovis]|uniref:Lysophospholipid acyltransferase 7 n=1 Tax=Caenorhabditis bovis TaxID=2654633 RepID=A0A8S1EJP4_9PELO|nr:unnamed protein product [Caenorhabditis bovis]
MDRLLGLMSKDDWIYTGILLTSFATAYFIKTKENNILLGGAIGFGMVLLILRARIVYSIIGIVFVLIVQQYAPKKHQTLVVFIGTFVYLMIVRFIHFILPVDEVLSHANVVQLIITLRVIGLTFEISDAQYNAKLVEGSVEDEKKKKRYLTQLPNLLEKLAYFYHFCGLFTGPYYTYQMLLDSQNPILKSWSSKNEVMKRVKRLLWSVPVFIIANRLCPLDTIRSDDVWNVSIWIRFIYAAAIFLVFRARVYSAWAIAESICVVLGIGIYPVESKPRIIVGPTDLEKFNELQKKENVEMDSEAIVNLNIPEVEFSNGFRDGMKAWNRSVQTWLAIYVHSRVKFMRVELTMLVSALWHGVYAGYFMSFGVVAMCAKLEDVIFRLVPVNPATGKRPAWFRYLYIHTIRCRGFEMLATGFLLKHGADVHRFWSSLYYWLPIVCIPFYIYDLMHPAPRKPKTN